MGASISAAMDAFRNKIDTLMEEASEAGIDGRDIASIASNSVEKFLDRKIRREKLQRERIDADVFDSMRALLADNIDLDDRAGVEKVIIYRYDDQSMRKFFIDWCIESAKVSKEAGGRHKITRGDTFYCYDPYNAHRSRA